MSEEELTIVVPWDFSNHAEAALEFARQQFSTSCIHVICVLERPNPYEAGFRWGVDSEVVAAQKCTTDFVEHSNTRRANEIDFDCRFGDPAEEIVRSSRTLDADYVVMSTHGRTGIQKLILGSVAQKVIAQADCPIILLPRKWYEAYYESDS